MVIMNGIVLPPSPLPVFRTINLAMSLKSMSESKFIKFIKRISKNNFVYTLLIAPVA